MLDSFRKLYDLLDARERRNALFLFGMMLIMGLFDAAGVASIMPFIAVVSNPELVHDNAYFAALYGNLGFTSTEDFLIFVGVVVFALVAGSLAFKALTQWAMARYTLMRDYSISSRLLQSYLSRPYSWFLNRHSADLGKSVLSEVQQVISQGLVPAVQLVANFVIALFLVGLIMVVDPVMALSVVFVLGGAYVVIYVALRKYLGRIGVDRLNANEERFRLAQEALGGIKDVKALRLEGHYLRSYRQPAVRYARHQANSQIIGQLPRYILEGVAIGGMIFLVLILMAERQKDLDSILGVVALYAFAGYRLMPALQQLYHAMTRLRFGKPIINSIHQDLVTASAAINEVTHQTSPIRLRDRLELKNIKYNYPNAENSALEELSFVIPANTTVALVGGSGAGKTTVIDIILGLLEPQQGKMTVDGIPIEQANTQAWQHNIGYVPQHIFLIDDTVIANIAFGVPKEEIDMAAVERAARIAELHEFVITNLPKGYDSMVGERGIRLSGGQRQRIGIARALYRNPDVLVLDEATSALDTLTEQAVMSAVHNLDHRKTIILIAHRLSTVRECDQVFLLERGRLIGQGRYDELVESNEQFSAMVGRH